MHEFVAAPLSHCPLVSCSWPRVALPAPAEEGKQVCPGCGAVWQVMEKPKPVAEPPLFVAGLDLGQSVDFTALAVAEVVRGADRRRHYTFGHLQRWPLGTSYPDIVEQLGAMLATLPSKPVLVVDGTGCGRPVVDMFQRARLPVKAFAPVTVTAGHETRYGGCYWCTPKRDLAGALSSVFQSRRIKFVKDQPEAQELLKELQTFTVKVNIATGAESFECLVGDTLVETLQGPVPLKDVAAGSMVLTRAGYRRVLWSGATKQVCSLTTVLLSNGAALRGTPDHLAWTENRGWVELGSLRRGDVLRPVRSDDLWEECATPRPRPLRSTGSNTSGRRVIPTTTTRPPSTPCTVPSGSTTTAPSPGVTTSTTRTATRRITTSPTLNASPTPSTPGATSRSTRRRGSSVLLAARSLRAAGAGCPGLTTPASGFAPSPVPTSAGNRGHSPASSAGGNFSQGAAAAEGSSASARHRAVNVTDICTSASPPSLVFDLVVEGEHEFFANGVLVHNSWREKDKDDLVLAVALAVWYTEKVHKELRADNIFI
jgi:hypothetical protein